jgi:methionyl-tRNA formyltransferase
MTNLVFMGSPQFAVPALDALSRAHTLLAVFTQLDKPAGRGKIMTAVPVKQWAEAHEAAVYQPRSFRKEPQFVDVLRSLAPDVIVVAAYGLILPQAVLDIPPQGCINVHASLLPRHRGAAPIASAILAGDDETGITLMKMDAGLDTGPMLAVAHEPIRSDDTTHSLSERLSHIGAQLMIETLPKYLRGEIIPQPQSAEGATYSPKIDKADAAIDWHRSAIDIDRMVRAYTPWPGTHTFWNGMMLKVLKVEARGTEQGARSMGQGTTGEVIRAEDGSIGVVTGSGLIVLKEIQPAGRKAMTIDDFVRGHNAFVGSVLSSNQSTN